MGGFRGQASDIDIQAREMARVKKEVNEVLAKHTGQPIDKIEKDTDRDFYMTAAEAIAYGIADEIFEKRIAVIEKKNS